MTEKNDTCDNSDNHAIKWKDIELASRVAPEYYSKALRWIGIWVGYLPAEGVYRPYLAIVQSRYADLIRTHKIDEQNVDEDIIIAKQIRNDDMKKGGWLINKFSDEKNRRAYDEILPMYKDRARKLLCTNMGYEPLIEHSFEAEIYLRHMFTMDDYHEGLKFSAMEIKAMTVAHYRSHYDLEGERSADESTLIGLIFNNWKQLNDIPLDL